MKNTKLKSIRKLNEKEMVNMNRELNLNELNEVFGGITIIAGDREATRKANQDYLNTLTAQRMADIEGTEERRTLFRILMENKYLDSWNI